MNKIPENINPFKLPENYFNEFSSNFELKIFEEKLKEKFGKKNPFVIPEKYFEKSEKEILSKLENENKFKFLSIKKIIPIIGMAASLLIIMLIWQLVLNKADKNKTIISAENKKQIETKISPDSVLIIKIKMNETVAEQIISTIDESTVIEAIIEEEITKEPKTDKNATIEYVADYADYSEIVALY
jgi:hypothetical protein